MNAAVASGELRASATNVFHLQIRVELAALGDVVLPGQPFGDDDVRERVEQRDVGAGPHLQVAVGLDVRRPHQRDLAADR